MKTWFMKKTALLFVLPFIALLSFAQVQRVVTPKPVDSTIHSSENGSEKNNKADRKQMFRELNLTKEQRAKIKEIREANKAKRDAIDSDDKLTQEQKDARLKELKREQAQSTLTILNDEQKAKVKSRRGKGQQDQ